MRHNCWTIYLAGRLAPAERLVMDAKLLLDPELRDKAQWQKRTYALVKSYGRQQLRQEIEAVHATLFSETRFETFRKKISRIFNR